MPPLLTVSTLFGLSLLAAVVLFRFLRSAALVKTTSYRAGGALAGFVIVYAAAFASVSKLEQANQNTAVADLQRQVARLNHELDSQRADLERASQQLKQTTVAGTVDPDKGPIRVRLVLDDQTPDSSGRFTFVVPRQVLESPAVSIHATTDEYHVIVDVSDGARRELPESSLNIYGEERVDNLRLPVRLQKRSP